MKPFVFRLQTKLDISKREEEILRTRLREKEKEAEEIEKELSDLQDDLSRIEDMARSFLKDSNIYFVSLIRDYLPVLKENIINCQERLSQAQMELEKVRQELMNKRREVKTLEKLKEKEWEDYLHEINLEEQKFIDEVAGSRHFFRQKNID